MLERNIAEDPCLLAQLRSGGKMSREIRRAAAQRCGIEAQFNYPEEEFGGQRLLVQDTLAGWFV
jgi:hypothetical protein